MKKSTSVSQLKTPARAGITFSFKTPNTMRYIQSLKKISGIDFHIISTLLMRSWTAIAGLVMILGMSKWFSAAEQGYYFTFYSLLGLQVFFELGFNYVVMQVVSHEIATANIDVRFPQSVDEGRLDRLTSLVRLLKRWYAAAAVSFFVAVTCAGMYFFRKVAGAGDHSWEAGWLLLVLFSATNLYLSPFLAVAEGAGLVGQVARLRLVQSIVGYSLLWILLTFGAGLTAVAVVGFVNAVGTAIWLATSGRFVNRISKRSVVDPSNSVKWRTEIFPFQWRIALSWMSGYLIFQIFNPVIFAYQGAVEAGRIGLALTVFTTLLSVSMSWVMAKAPVMATHIARGEPLQARSLLRRLVLRSGIFHLLASVGILAGVWLMQQLGIELVNRIADLRTLVCIAVVTQVNHFIGSIAAYLRAHKSEPLLISSLVVAILSLLAVLIGAHYSVFVTMLLYSIVTVGVSLPWLLFIFRNFDSPAVAVPQFVPQAASGPRQVK